MSNSATPWIVALQAPLFHGNFQARILEWVAIPFSRGSSLLRNETQVLQADSLPSEPPGKPSLKPKWFKYSLKPQSLYLQWRMLLFMPQIFTLKIYCITAKLGWGLLKLHNNVLCYAKSLQLYPTVCDPMDCSQASLSMGFSRQEYGSRLPCSPLGILSTQGLNPHLLYLLHWQHVFYH